VLDRVLHAPADLDGVVDRFLELQVADQGAQRAAVDIFGDHMRLAHKCA
jgi:hypothetical protein